MSGEWQPIETAPIGNEENGPFFDVCWSGSTHRYLPVLAREVDCYRRGNSIARQHGYPSMTTIFLDRPTHWRPSPADPISQENTDGNQ